MNLLTIEQIKQLPDDTHIMVIWTGGNGPHKYRLKHISSGDKIDSYALDINSKDSMPAYYNELDFVGQESYQTRVWLPES